MMTGVDAEEVPCALPACIAARRALEDRIARLEERQDHVLGGIPVALFTATCETPPRTTWVSSSINEVCGFPPQRFLDDPFFWLSRVHPEDRERVASDLDARVTGRVEVSVVEYRWRCADDEYRWFRGRTTTHAGRDGRPAEMVGGWLRVDGLQGAKEDARRANAMADLNLRLEDAREKNQQRIARDLHDQLGSKLAAVLLRLETLEDSLAPGEARAAAAEIREDVRATVTELVRVVRGLHPVAMDAGTITSAIGQLARELERIYRVRAQVVTEGIDEDQLARRTALVLYRIVQEALTNVGKHAAAKNVSVVVRGGADRRVHVVVEDDGRGFDPDTPPTTAGLGLEGMRERAALLGGTFTIESAVGRGTAVHVVVPLDPPPSSRTGA